MALSSPNTLGGLTRAQNHLAAWFGKTAFTNLDATEQSLFNDFFEMALNEIATECLWTFLRRESDLTTTSGYSTGTIQVTNNSTAVVGTTTLWAANVAANDKILVGTEAAPYRITSVTNDTNLVLSTPYGGSNASTLTYQVSRDEYELANGMWWLRHIREIRTPRPLTIVGYDYFMEKLSTRVYSRGRPQYCIMLGADTSATSTTMEQRVQFWPAPDDTYPIYYAYHTLPTWPTNNFETHPQAMNLLLHKTLALAFAKRQRMDLSNFHEKKYEDILPKFKNMDESRSSSVIIMADQWNLMDGTKVQTGLDKTVTE